MTSSNTSHPHRAFPARSVSTLSVPARSLLWAPTPSSQRADTVFPCPAAVVEAAAALTRLARPCMDSVVVRDGLARLAALLERALLPTSGTRSVSRQLLAKF